MKTVDVLIVDDHPAMRHGLSVLFENEAGLAPGGEAGSRAEALAAIRKRPPGVVVLDIALGDTERSGLELIPEIHAHAGPVPVLVFSMHDEMLYAERALRLGARGYLMKQEPVRRVAEAIRRILDGGIYLSEVMSQKLLSRHVGTAGSGGEFSSPDALSPREFEVFRLVGKGLPPRDIAEALHLSVKTVETHRMNVRRKIGLENAAALARYAVKWFRENG